MKKESQSEIRKIWHYSWDYASIVLPWEGSIFNSGGCRRVAEWRTCWWQWNFQNISRNKPSTTTGYPFREIPYSASDTLYVCIHELTLPNKFVYIYVTEMRAPQWSSIHKNSNDIVLDLWLPSRCTSIRAPWLSQAAYYVHKMCVWLSRC